MRRVYFQISFFGPDGKASLKRIQDIHPINTSDLNMDQNKSFTSFDQLQSPIMNPVSPMNSTSPNSFLPMFSPQNGPSTFDKQAGNNQAFNQNYSTFTSFPQKNRNNRPHSFSRPYSDSNRINRIRTASNDNHIKPINNSLYVSQLQQQNVTSNSPLSILSQKQQLQQILTEKTDPNNQEREKSFLPYHSKQYQGSPNKKILQDKQIQKQEQMNEPFQETIPWSEGGEDMQIRKQTGDDFKIKDRGNIMSNLNFSKGMKSRFEKKVATIKDNERIRAEMNNSFSACYSNEEKMRPQRQTQISQFMLGGYDFVDYSSTINKLHKKLLRKVILDK